MGEDADQIKLAQTQYHWDKRKKKYVKLSGREEVSKSTGKRIVK